MDSHPPPNPGRFTKLAAALFAKDNLLPRMRYRLVRELAADGFDVTVARRVLGASRSGYYPLVRRWPSSRDLQDAYLANTIFAIHAASRCSYGSPRVHAELGLAMGV